MAQEEQIIISDLLSYMACNIDICEKAALIETIQNYYPEEVISETLDTLVSAIPSKIYKRLSSLTVNDAADAIYSYLKLLPKKKIPIFVCRNLNNLPGAESDADSIELNDDIPMVDIRSQQEEMKNVIGEISKSVNLMKNQVQLLVHRAIKHHLHDSEEADVDLSNSDTIQSLPYLQSLIYRNNRKRQAAVDTDDYGIDTVENNIRLEDAEEDIHDDLFPPDELTNMPNHRTLKFETADGHLLMTTSNDAMNFDENLCSDNENMHNIEVRDDNRPIIEVRKKDTMEYRYSKADKVLKTNEEWMIVDEGFDESKGSNFTYRCRFCDFCTNNKKSASQHQLVGSCGAKDKTYTCNFCSFKHSDVMVINSHLSMHNTIEPDETYECVLCYYKSGDQSEYKSHLSTHSWKKPFKCGLCSYKGYDEYRMKCHSLKHAEFKSEHEYECQICLKICGTLKALKRHKLLHARKYDFQCQYCNITYKNKSTLANHVLSHTKEKSFSCSYCNRICDSKYTLFMHEKVHFREHNYSCSLCKMQFKNRNTRRFHIITKHPDLKPYQCDICQATFTFEQSFLVHRNTHNEDENRTVSCPYCKKKFKSVGYMKMHVGWIHFGSKPFKCSLCDFQARLKSDVNKHEASHRMEDELPSSSSIKLSYQ